MLTSKIEYILMCTALLLISLIIGQLSADLFLFSFVSSFIVMLHLVLSYQRAGRTVQRKRPASVLLVLPA